MRVPATITAISFLFLSFIYHKRRLFRELVLPLLFGASIGLFFGFILSTEAGVDVVDHIQIVKSEEQVIKQAFGLRCVIIIHPQSAKPVTIMEAMRDGFTKGCNQTIFFTTDEDFFKQLSGEYPIVFIDSFSNEFFWNFYQQVMAYSAEDPMEWTYIGDDQTYLIVENLRRALHKHNSRENIMLGRVTTSRSFLSYLFPLLTFSRVSVQSGIAISNEALGRLVTCKGFLFPRATESALYQCAQDNGVQIIDPIDEEGMHLLLDQPPSQLIQNKPSSFVALFPKSSQRCCSDQAITFGRMSVNEMRVVEYGIHFHVFGRAGYTQSNKPIPATTLKLQTVAIPPEIQLISQTNEKTNEEIPYAIPKRVEPKLRI